MQIKFKRYTGARGIIGKATTYCLDAMLLVTTEEHERISNFGRWKASVWILGDLTSWTSGYSVAENYATRQSGSGVIMTNTFAPESAIPSPMGYSGGESEFLIRGPVSGSQVSPVP